jgi:hypothetical protein
MSRALTGIQIGPRQFELPPNMPVSDSPAGSHAVLLAPELEDVGVLLRGSARASGCRAG